MGLKYNADGSIRDFTQAEIDAMEIKTAGIRDGTHPTHSRGMNSSTATRQYFVNGDPDILDDAIAYFLGGSVQYTTSGGVLKISRLMPQTFPNKPSFAAIAIESITGAGGAGIDNDDDLPEYPKMRMTVRYEHVPFTLKSDTNTTLETERYVQTMPASSDVSYLTLPGGTLNYIVEGGSGTVSGGDGTPRPHLIPIPYTIGRPEGQSTRSFKWLRVPWEVWQPGSTIFNRVFGDYENSREPFIGTVNSYPLYSIPAGQLLYLGVEEELVTDPLGDALCWHLTHKFLHKPRNHNWLYFNDAFDASSNAAGYYLAGRGTTYYTTENLPDNTALFNARDHRLLFDPEPT